MAVGEISAGGTIIGGMIGQRGAQGISVKKIEKTDTQGLIDTYTITYSNNETSTFEVTNGAKGDTGNTGTSITGVAFGSSSGLVDTYIVSFSNGTTSSFNVTNGKGISNIAYTSTSGLTDTYTITYNDNTTSTFSITNGTTFIPSLDENGNLSWSNDGGKINPPTRNIKGQKGDVGNGIASIVKTSSSGLVDTYTITFTDGGTTTFEVTNGEDGEVTLEELQEVQAELDKYKMLENALPKVAGEGETISLDKTAKSPMSLTLKGNIEQDGEPTPTNPIDIHIVSGDNTIEICGKNLLDKNATTTGYLVSRTTGELSRSGGYQASDYIRVKAGTTYTQSNTSRYYSVYYDNEKNYLTYIGTATFTPSQDGYIRTTIANADIDIAQVEVGSSASEYEAYKGYTKEINLGDIEVGGIGDYEDEFFKNTTDSEYYDSTLELDKWYLKKRIGKVVLDGSEDGWNLSSTETNTTKFYREISDIINGTTNTAPPNLLSNYFTPKTYEYYYYNDVTCIAQYGGSSDTARKRVYIRINNTNATTTQQLQSWLSTHNTIVYYVLATPENILLNDTLQETLDSFVSYQEQTNISQTNNDLPFVIKARAIYDLSNLVSRVATLEEGE